MSWSTTRDVWHCDNLFQISAEVKRDLNNDEKKTAKVQYYTEKQKKIPCVDNLNLIFDSYFLSIKLLIYDDGSDTVLSNQTLFALCASSIRYT